MTWIYRASNIRRIVYQTAAMWNRIHSDVVATSSDAKSIRTFEENVLTFFASSLIDNSNFDYEEDHWTLFVEIPLMNRSRLSGTCSLVSDNVGAGRSRV